ncbi:hypothetical protein FIBSPDRAFT_902323 [Athelia psychrophila]|uniref:F-box domain-containing protein n=1 Tax=Athelia psychrophila TaxID=1759441 RepID=A0A167XD31_9AGAM|nr:hypothetical protein FIBSPDRAFT_902323 [Fibularhizoctonia sp. CBS 109695]
MPFHDLALEVACEIFRQADFATPVRLPDPRSIPVVVSSVCKGWRNAAIHYRSLWTLYKIQGSSLLRNGSIFLARAGHCPVYATIHGDPAPSRLVYNMFSSREGPSYISVDSKQWFYAPHADFTIHEASLCGKVARVLARKDDPRLDAFIARHARLDNVKVLTLDGVQTEDMAACLSWMPKLVCLTITPIVRSGVPESCPSIPATPINLPHLEKFCLALSPHNKFYGGIVAPSLLSLEFNLGRFHSLELRDFAAMIGQISSIALSGLIYNLHPTPHHFPTMENITTLRMDMTFQPYGPSCPQNDANPANILHMMKRDVTILPNLRQFHTNAVWYQNALDLLWEMHIPIPISQRPPPTLSIFYKCARPTDTIRRLDLIKPLMAAKIVYLFRRYS